MWLFCVLLAVGSDPLATTGDSSSPWPAAAAIVINAGFAGFVGWYLLTKAGPKLQQDFSQMLKEQRNDFISELSQKRLDFIAEEKSRAESFARVIDSVHAHCEKELSRRDESFRVEMTLVSRAIEDMREVLEEVRDSLHSLRNRE